MNILPSVVCCGDPLAGSRTLLAVESQRSGVGGQVEGASFRSSGPSSESLQRHSWRIPLRPSPQSCLAMGPPPHR